MIVTIAATGGIGWVLFNQLVGVANELPRYQQNIHNKLEAMRAPGEGALGRATASIQELAAELTSVEPPAAPVPSDRGSRPLPVRLSTNPQTNWSICAIWPSPFWGLWPNSAWS